MGTGLIGASVGLAARRAGVSDVRGWDVDDEALVVAGERGAVEPAASLAEAVADAELAVVAAPVTTLPTEVANVLAASGDGTTVTDVGSTKGPVARAVTDSRFIGGHPVCGSEAVVEEQLQARYMTLCDPRLNARQSLDVAFRVAELMRSA